MISFADAFAHASANGGLPRRYWISRARVPACFLSAPVAGADADFDGALLLDILIDGDRLVAIAAAGAAPREDACIDAAGRMVWPTLVDMHTHLDKAQVIPRVMPDGSFAGGRTGTVKDREFWSHDDLRRRMDFALRCSYVHGVSAVRTHIDSFPELAERSWEVFRELRAKWAGRVALQGVSLFTLDLLRTDYGVKIADLTAASGGVLGGVTRAAGKDHVGTLDDTDALLDRLLALAAERGLDVDLHVDESADLTAFSLPRIAAAVIRNRFAGRLVCGHCINLALQPEEVARRTIELCAEARLNVVTLPAVMMYLQDREPRRTPRWRGVTLVHEFKQAGVPVAIGGDNVRDTWNAYGDHDMVEAFRQSVLILQLDHPFGDAPTMAGAIPGEIIREPSAGRLAVGGPANLIAFSARTLNELMCRPQSDRVVLNRGRPVRDKLPDYAELDPVET
jgi:cytosine deaminase